MRTMMLGVCVLSAACSGQGGGAPTAPTQVTAVSSGGAPAALARADVGVPLRGSFSLENSSSLDCPPDCPPTTLRISGTMRGTASHLGLFTATFADVVDIAAKTATGTLRFTAANGDELFTTTAGGEDAFTPPNVSHVTTVATIVGGTGRFAQATGTVTVEYTQTIQFQLGTAAGSGSFSGTIDLHD